MIFMTMMIGPAVHILAVAIWVGGLFFASFVLQPSAQLLEPATRLAYLNRVFARFFLWVWISIAAVLISGFAMIIVGFGGFATIPIYVRAMMGLGVLATAVHAYLYFVPWRRFRRHMSSIDPAAAERSIRQVRLLVAVNLTLGLVTAVLGASGRYYG